ncbi:MAG: LegC family aminotransferase [Xanthobacteraceae bacterium]|nr:LegC family aminotransferase [Xanthobacteraceae bacterium]
MQSEARKPAPVNPSRIVAKAEAVLGSAPRPIALHEPNFGPRERALVIETIDTGWVSSGGRFVDQFEQTVARYVGAKHGIAIVNGTAALHLALILAGVRSGDEVLVPTITFVATANAVRHANATPHFVDVSWKTLGIDADALDHHLQEAATMQGGVLVNSRTKRPIRGVVPMHAFGHPVDFDALQKVAAKYNLVIVEDAAEALGSQYVNTPCGSLGLCAALSFNGNKIVTTGGGGMIVTNDDALAVRARHISTTAKLPHAWEFLHDEVGYNYRLPNLNAALGCAQMERIDEFVTAKRNLAGRYIDAFAKSEDGTILAEPSGTRSNYWLNTLVLSSSNFAERDAVLSALHAARILARPVWTPMHLLPMYKELPRAPLPVAEDIHRRCINLPSSAALAARQ